MIKQFTFKTQTKSILKLKSIMGVLTLMISFGGAKAYADLKEQLFLRSEMQSSEELLLKTLQSDTKLNQTYQLYVKESQNILNHQSLTAHEKQKLIANLNLKYQSFLRALLNKAGLTEEILHKKGAVAFAKMSQKFKRKYDWKRVDTLNFVWKTSQNTPHDQPQPIKPLPLEIILTPPYEFRHSRVEFGGSARVNLENGRFEANSNSHIIGGNTAEAGLGHFYVVPEGYRRLILATDLPETLFTLSSGSIVGASGADAYSTIEILKNGDVFCQKRFHHGSVMTLIAWASFLSEIDNIALNCPVSSPQRSEELVVNFRAEASSWAGANGHANSTVIARPRDIRIQLEP